MTRPEIQKVLRNWIDQANSPTGKFDDGIDPAQWVADRFVEWWRDEVRPQLNALEEAAEVLREELDKLKNPRLLDAAIHEAGHIEDYLSDLRMALGFEEEDEPEPHN